jgi:hypothetical protein
MALMRRFMQAAPLVNAPVRVAVNSRLLGRLLGRSVTLLTYTGRKSGREFSIPVAYRRNGDELTIAANVPDAKTWWRNFLGEGGPVTVRLGGVDHQGHALARRDEKGRVTVTVSLQR